LQPARKWGLIIAIAVLLVSGLIIDHRRNSSSSPNTIGPRPHLIAPDFTLPQLDGQQLQLSSYRGKVVLLDFWATWCVPCREEIPHFIELQDKYRDKGLQIIGISMDDGPDPVKAFYQQFHMNYPVVMGDAKTGELYGGVLGLPIAFVIDRTGRITSKHIGATRPEVIEKEVAALFQKG
jgi:cytochrome c biogenesis protein CcmG, thiol:disulfide interchange protein DsbE